MSFAKPWLVKWELQMAEHIPEDVIAKIFQWLPIKSLIRFTSISKRWRFIILRDPHFATSQFQIASGNNKSVCFLSYSDSNFFESLNLQTTTSALRNLRCPFKQPDSMVFIHSSCRGLMFATFVGQGMVARYIWNPSTGFFKKLPDPGVKDEFLVFSGFGYISATDDYKILIANSKLEEGEEAKIHIFSSKSNSWKRIQDSQYSASSTTIMGTLLNEALHWLEMFDDVIVAFDLADEEFRTMPLPVVEDHYAGDYFRHLRVLGGCLCVFGQADTNAGSMDMWVMREYDAGNSWTKLFNLKFSNQPEGIISVNPIWVMETSTFLEINSNSETRVKLVRSYYNEEEIEEIHMDRRSMIGYEESLLWLE